MTVIEFLTARLDEAEAAARNDRNPAHPVGGMLHAMSRHDATERVLRDVAAKRQVIGLLSADLLDPHNAVRREWAADALRAMAAVYEDHPDHRDDWSIR